MVSALDLLLILKVRKVLTSSSSPLSRISAGESDSVTTGVVSSSAITRITGSGSITLGLLVFATAAETVKLTSPVWSSLSTPIIVTVPPLTVSPAGMVNVLLPLNVTALLGEADRITTVSSLDTLCSVAFTVLVPPSSGSQYCDSVRPALGEGEVNLRRKFALITLLSFRVPTAAAGPSAPVDGWSVGTPMGSPL